MTFTHQQQILHKEFLDEYIGEHTLDNFIEWCKYEMDEVGEAPDPNTPTRPVEPFTMQHSDRYAQGKASHPCGCYYCQQDDRKCFKCLKGEGHNG